MTGSLTTGPIARTLLAFSLPVLGSNILQSINGSINALWVGHFLGEVGLAATANANLIIFLIISMVFGFGMAGTILIGQHMGRGEIEAVRRATGTGATLFLISGILIATLGWVSAPLMLHAMGTPAEVYPSALPYLRMMFAGMPPALMTVYLAMTLRGVGDSLTPLVAMLPGIVVEVALNPVLILGLGPAPHMGIAGSALATLIANFVQGLTLLYLIYRRDLPIRLRGAELRYLKPAAHLVRFIIVKGVPLGLQMIVVAGSAVVMMVLVNREGTATVAAYGAVTQLWTYIQMPSFAIGMAVSGMAAQNIGAGLWHRVDRIAWTGMGVNLVLTGTIVTLTLLLDGPMLRLFLPHHEDAVAIGQHINLLASWSFIIQGMTLALSSVVRANGAGIIPLLILVIAFIPGRVGSALGLEPWLGTDAIWWSFPVGSILSLILNQIYYRHGSWKKLIVAAPQAVKAAEQSVAA
ncbi:MAG TPA: MATE family efflux transporter [Sphingobium sp.]